QVKKEFTLVGHTAGVECLAISPDGRMLVSGDDAACVLLWNLATGERVQTISCPFNGAISAVIWVQLRESNDLCFVFGCADGSLHLYRRYGSKTTFEFVFVIGEAHQGPVEDLAFDALHHRVASVGGGHPQVWKLSSQGILDPLVQSPPQSNKIARNISFFEGGCNVLVSYLESHEISCFTIEPWNLKWTRSVASRIGFSTLCGSNGVTMFISNLVDGIDEYRLPDLEKIKAFPHAIKSNFPLRVVTAFREGWLVSGGDSGFARLFDRRTGRLLQLLEHPNTSMTS
ncbi:WD40 repeat-like protein, partial [Schizopora paradoxa]